jgi:hypothetical protein
LVYRIILLSNSSLRQPLLLLQYGYPPAAADLREVYRCYSLAALVMQVR